MKQSVFRILPKATTHVPMLFRPISIKIKVKNVYIINIFILLTGMDKYIDSVEWKSKEKKKNTVL